MSSNIITLSILFVSIVSVITMSVNKNDRRTEGYSEYSVKYPKKVREIETQTYDYPDSPLGSIESVEITCTHGKCSKSLEQFSENKPEQLSEGKQEQLSEGKQEQIVQQFTEDKPEQIVQQFSENKPEQLSEGKPEQLKEKPKGILINKNMPLKSSMFSDDDYNDYVTIDFTKSF